MCEGHATGEGCYYFQGQNFSVNVYTLKVQNIYTDYQYCCGEDPVMLYAAPKPFLLNEVGLH